MAGYRMLLGRLAAHASESPAVLAIVSWASKMLLGDRCTDSEAIAECLPVKLLGYPFFLLGIPNCLHIVGVVQRIRNRNMPLRAVPKRPLGRNMDALRIGIVGEMTFGGARPRALVEQFPVGPHKLFVFDACGAARCGPIPEREDIHFSRHDLGGDYSRIAPKKVGKFGIYLQAMRKLVEDINAAGLDMLIIANASLEEKNDIATLVDTPCLVGYPMGSEPVFNQKMDFTLYKQHKIWYYLAKNRLCSIFTKRPLTAEVCCDRAPALYEIGPTVPPDIPWDAREHLMIFHGRLAQIHSREYLALLADLLGNDEQLRFEFFGPGDATPILKFFEGRGLAGQVACLGVIDKAELVSGGFHKKLYSILTRARLAPNPWPLGGGLSRIEAYHAGIPTVHLRMTPRLNWASESTWVDLPCIEVPSSTADTVEDYRMLCRKCLYDREFADVVRREQRRIAERSADARAWWDSVMRLYREWAMGTGWTEQFSPNDRVSPPGIKEMA